MTKTRIAALVLGSLLFLAGVALGQKIDAGKYPELAAAQDLCMQAYEKLTAAQRASKYAMGGHALKAKQLLEQVNEQLKAAAAAADTNKEK